MNTQTSLVAEQIRLQQWADQIRDCQNRPSDMAAFAALSGGGDPLLLVLPSDHVLKPQDVFAEAVARARACAESGRPV